MRSAADDQRQPIDTSPGETLIDAALGGWMIIPHDCRSGQCESCRVTVVSGSVDDRRNRNWAHRPRLPGPCLGRRREFGSTNCHPGEALVRYLGDDAAIA